MHLIRYDYDEELERTPVRPVLTLELRLPERFEEVSLFGPADWTEASLTLDGNLHRLTLRDVPLYGVVLLGRAERRTERVRGARVS